MNTAEISANGLYEIRQKLNLSREQFAQLLSVSYKTICRWETEGIRSITNKKLIALQKVLASQNGLSTIQELLRTQMGLVALSIMLPVLGQTLEITPILRKTLVHTINNLLEIK